MMPVRRVNADKLPTGMQAVKFVTAEQGINQENIRTKGSFYKPSISEFNQSNGMILLIKI
jgi:hypothetical protein